MYSWEQIKLFRFTNVKRNQFLYLQTPRFTVKPYTGPEIGRRLSCVFACNYKSSYRTEQVTTMIYSDDALVINFNSTFSHIRGCSWPAFTIPRCPPRMNGWTVGSQSAMACVIGHQFGHNRSFIGPVFSRGHSKARHGPVDTYRCSPDLCSLALHGR